MASNGDLSEFARAKVNLALHITGQRNDGYHLLDSLVVFPRIGDRLSADEAAQTSFSVVGPFASALASEQNSPEDNLVLKALDALQSATGTPLSPLKLELNKCLPVASGIGGGSADAAAALRLGLRLGEHTLAEEHLQRLALSLGADVPVCLKQAPCRMSGIGETLHPVPALPAYGIVLVNPQVAVSTPAIFRNLACRDNAPLPTLPESFDKLDDLVNWLKLCRNDMQITAETLCPPITQVIDSLSEAPQTLLTRMSGSGATCFALCRPADTQPLATHIQKAHPDWWVGFSSEESQS